MVIPTLSKTKLGVRFSYPIGAEAITAALGDVPQAAGMTIRFHAYSLHRARWDRPYVVADIDYSNRRPDNFTPRAWKFGGPRWEIHIRAVPKEVRHTVQLLLKETLVAQARPWLLSHTDIYEGVIGIRITYDPSSKQLLVDFSDQPAPTLLRHRQPVSPHDAD